MPTIDVLVATFAAGVHPGGLDQEVRRALPVGSSFTGIVADATVVALQFDLVPTAAEIAAVNAAVAAHDGTFTVATKIQTLALVTGVANVAGPDTELGRLTFNPRENVSESQRVRLIAEGTYRSPAVNQLRIEEDGVAISPDFNTVNTTGQFLPFVIETNTPLSEGVHEYVLQGTGGAVRGVSLTLRSRNVSPAVFS